MTGTDPVRMWSPTINISAIFIILRWGDTAIDFAVAYGRNHQIVAVLCEAGGVIPPDAFETEVRVSMTARN